MTFDNEQKAALACVIIGVVLFALGVICAALVPTLVPQLLQVLSSGDSYLMSRIRI